MLLGGGMLMMLAVLMVLKGGVGERVFVKGKGG